MQWTNSDGDEISREVIAPVGLDTPDGPFVVPLQFCDAGVEQCFVIEIVVMSDAPAVLADLWAVGEFLGRNMSGLLQQRHVDERGGVAHDSGIPIPIPYSAEVSGLVDDADIVDARILEACRGDEPCEAATDGCKGHMIGLWLTGRHRHVGVDGFSECSVLDSHVLVETVVALTLVAFFCVLLVKRIGCGL